MKIPFYRADIGVTEKDYIVDLLNSKSVNCVEELESVFESYTGASFALATSHGTSALHLAMLALDLKRGDKVLCCVNAFPSIPEVVRHFDAEPIFIDIDEDSFNIDLNKLEEYLVANNSKKLKAVIVSHVAGQMVDLERLYKMAEDNNVKVIEDATDALGCDYNGSKIGSTGADITCFSFNPHLKKGISNGGMLVSDNEEIIERAKLLRNHGLSIDEEGPEYLYNIIDIGTNYTMSQLDAAYILAQLEKQDKFISRQKEIAKKYNSALEGVDHITLPQENENHSYSLYIIKIDKNRDSFAKEMQEKGIVTGVHYIPLHLMSYYKTKYALRINDYPVALRNYSQILSIPIYPSLSDKEIDYICNTIKDIAKNRV
jgi:dTDP-4-amino-4,6-dideoxygalactose transaminase